MATAIPFSGWQSGDANGTPASGGKIYFYVVGTTTPQNTYSDSALTTPNTNPVVMDASGWPGPIYLSSELAYDYIVKSADDATTYVARTTIPANVSGAQPVDATLTAIAGLTVANGEVIRATGVDTFESTSPSNLTATPTGGTDASALAAALAVRGLTPADFGLTSGGVTDADHTKMAALLAIGGLILVPAGTWPLPNATLTTPVHIVADPAAVFVANTLPTAASKGVLTLAAGSEGSTFTGGEWDGDRAAVMDIALTGTWTSSGTSLTGSGGAALTEVSAGDFIRYNNRSRSVASVGDDNTITLDVAFTASNRGGEGESGEFTAQAITKNSYLTNASTLRFEADRCSIANAKLVNAMQWSVYNTGDDFLADNLVVQDCGAGILNGYLDSAVYNSRIRDVHFIDCGHNGSEYNRHVFQVYDNYYCSYRNIHVDGVPGNNDTAYVSTVTFVRGRNNVGEDIMIEGVVGDATQVGFSLLAWQNSELRNPKVNGVCGTMMEVAGCNGSRIVNYLLDGQYATTEWAYEGACAGINVRVIENYGHQAVTNPVEFHSGRVIRVSGSGVQVADAEARFYDTHSSHNLKHGIFCNAGSVPGETPYVECFNTHEDFNGMAGLYGSGARHIHKHGGSCNNNGQDSTQADGVRVGLNASSLESGGDFRIRDIDADDDQGVTWSDVLSYAPGSMTSVSVETSGGTATRYRYPFTRIGLGNGFRLNLGQVITLEGAGASGADLTGKIVDVDANNAYEDFVVEFTSNSAVEVPAGSRSAISGTWSGASTTLTGTSGAAESEVNWNDWISFTPFTEWKRVTAKGSDDSLTIESAFSSAPVGATMNVVRGDITTIKSQQRGISAAASTGFMCGSYPSGNVEFACTVTAASMLPGSEFYSGFSTTGLSATDTIITSNFGNAGIEVKGARMICTAAVGGITDWEIAATINGGASDLGILLTDTGTLALNDKATNGAAGVISSANSPDLRFRTTGTPTGSGAIKTEFWLAVNRLEDFVDV